jgi:hypothetical protein
MNQHLPSLQAAALAAAIALAAPAAAKDVMKAKTVGAYRVELHVLPAGSPSTLPTRSRPSIQRWEW